MFQRAINKLFLEWKNRTKRKPLLVRGARQVGKASAILLFFWRTKDGREVDFVIEKGGRFIAFEAKLTGMPVSDTARGFEYLREYYGEDSLLKGFVICWDKREFSIGKGIKAVNGIQFDF
jgi:predicted AAA+ superfamily ATPase